MGTRGAYGLRKNGKDKITYNHFDSDPDWLGKAIVEFIQTTPVEEIKKIFDKLVMVDDAASPAPRTAKLYQESLNSSVGGGTKLTWYNYLRGGQGNLSFYKDKKHIHMIDSHEFIKDSLFCEYAYIINLDTEQLEFYTGFNKNKGANGRYAKLHSQDRDSDYLGVALACEIPLAKIIPGTKIESEIVNIMTAAEPKEEAA